MISLSAVQFISIEIKQKSKIKQYKYQPLHLTIKL